MKLKILMSVFASLIMASASNAAPLWNSIVLDDFSAPLSGGFDYNIADGVASNTYGFATANSPGITGRRDMGMSYNPSGASGSNNATISVPGGTGGLTYNDNNGLGTGTVGFALQYDYADAMTSAVDPLTGLDTGSPTATVSAGYSSYVIDLGTVTGTFDLTFYVMGDTAADYATASTTVTAADSNSLLEFTRNDFYGDLNGTFTNNLTNWIHWAPNVTSFGVTAFTPASLNTNTIQFSEVYATIPEPGSLLAMAGLFGGAGLVGFRRKRAAKKAAKA